MGGGREKEYESNRVTRVTPVFFPDKVIGTNVY